LDNLLDEVKTLLEEYTFAKEIYSFSYSSYSPKKASISISKDEEEISFDEICLNVSSEEMASNDLKNLNFIIDVLRKINKLLKHQLLESK